MKIELGINPNWIWNLLTHILRSKTFNIFLGSLFALLLAFFIEKAVHTQVVESEMTVALFKVHKESIENILLLQAELINRFKVDKNIKLKLKEILNLKTGFRLINDNHQKLINAIWNSEEIEMRVEDKFKPFHKAQFLFQRRIDRALSSGKSVFDQNLQSKSVAEMEQIKITLITYQLSLKQLKDYLIKEDKDISFRHYFSTGLVSLLAVLCFLLFGKVFYNASKEYFDEKKRVKFRVLIVDDDLDVLETIIENCSQEVNCQFHAAHNGVDALKKIGERTYDLVISDVSMPNMGGIELAKKVTKLGEVPIVLMTCNSTVKLSQEVFGQSRVYYIYDKFEVLNNIEKIISNALSEEVSGQSQRKAS